MHGLFDLTNDVPVGLAGVHLHPRAPVDGDGGGPRLLADLGKRHRVHAAAVPALAEFHRHRLIHSGADGLNDAPGQLRVPHKGRAVAGFDDLSHGAAHVDIQNIRPGSFQGHTGGLGHDLRLVAEDLYGAGVLVLGDIQQGFGLFIVVDQGLGADHLRGGEGRALLTADLPEGEIRHPGHGAQRQPPLEFHIADLYHVMSSPTGQWSEPMTSDRM